MTLQERLRFEATTLRTKSMPLAHLIPLLQQAADALDAYAKATPNTAMVTIPVEEYQRLKEERDYFGQRLAQLEAVPMPPVEMAWECNECGSQEYTMSVSEEDVQNLGCGNCGGAEWHKERSRK